MAKKQATKKIDDCGVVAAAAELDRAQRRYEAAQVRLGEALKIYAAARAASVGQEVASVAATVFEND